MVNLRLAANARGVAWYVLRDLCCVLTSDVLTSDVLTSDVCRVSCAECRVPSDVCLTNHATRNTFEQSRLTPTIHQMASSLM